MTEFRFAFRQSLPVLITYSCIGLAFGMLMANAGYSPLAAFCSSVFIYAGAMQILLVSLLVDHLPLYLMAAMTFFINARHMFYGIAFLNIFRSMGWRYPYMVASMTDEVYSIFCGITVPEGLDRSQVRFYIALLCHSAWSIAGLIGAWTGSILSVDLAGIDFAATSLFLTAAVNQWKQYTNHIPVYIGVGASLLSLALIGSEHFLLPALCLALGSLIFLREKVSVQGDAFHE